MKAITPLLIALLVCVNLQAQEAPTASKTSKATKQAKVTKVEFYQQLIVKQDFEIRIKTPILVSRRKATSNYTAKEKSSFSIHPKKITRLT